MEVKENYPFYPQPFASQLEPLEKRRPWFNSNASKETEGAETRGSLHLSRNRSVEYSMIDWLEQRTTRGFSQSHCGPAASSRLSLDGFKRRMYAHSSFVHRLNVESVLDGHRGCVNSLSWDVRGEWLISGSDDRRLNIWKFPPAAVPKNSKQDELFKSIPSSHGSNIFASKFFPLHSSTSVAGVDLQPPDRAVSCAADGSVLVTDIHGFMSNPVAFQPAQPFMCHADMAFDVEGDPASVHCFFSCSNDGTVNLYDLRIRSHCLCQVCNRHTFIDVNAFPTRHRGGFKMRQVGSKSAEGVAGSTLTYPLHHMFGIAGSGDVGVCAMAINPDNHLQIALGCSDDFVRIYDRRFLAAPIYRDPSDSDYFNDTLRPPSAEPQTPDSSSSWESVDSAESSLSPDTRPHIPHPAYRMMPSSTESYKGLVYSYCCNASRASTFFHEWDKYDINRNPPTGSKMPPLMIWGSGCVDKISSLCYDPSGSGQLLVGYMGNNIHRIQPSIIRNCAWDGLCMDDDHFRMPAPSLSNPNSQAKRRRSPDPMESNIPTMLMHFYSPKHVFSYDRDQLEIYTGHVNIQTMIKDAKFFGDCIVSGSDDCGIYIWRKSNYRTHFMTLPFAKIDSDSNIVNCVAPHPFMPCLAVSGLDETIKLVTPCGKNRLAGCFSDCQICDLLNRLMLEFQRRLLICSFKNSLSGMDTFGEAIRKCHLQSGLNSEELETLQQEFLRDVRRFMAIKPSDKRHYDLDIALELRVIISCVPEIGELALAPK